MILAFLRFSMVTRLMTLVPCPVQDCGQEKMGIFACCGFDRSVQPLALRVERVEEGERGILMNREFWLDLCCVCFERLLWPE